MTDGKTRKPGKSILEKRKLKHQKRAVRDADRRRRELTTSATSR